jgi:hypothetical protein
MVLELLEHAAHVATDPKRVYYFGGGINPSRCPGAPLISSNEACLRPADSGRLRTCSTV